MTDIGVEVGQKMRSAIKAKLMELECYVDDELPDYIMVMVANKRTKSQMNEDLQLFLGSKTNTFVEWLHIVLKKLKEVHVTNSNVFKNAIKRKIEDPEMAKRVKKERKDAKVRTVTEVKEIKKELQSLTDNLPLNIGLLHTNRKVTVSVSSSINDFDIPTISEVNLIKSVKSRLGDVVVNDSEEDFLNLKAEPDDMFPNEPSQKERMKEKLRKVDVIRSLTPPIPPTVTVERNMSNATEQEAPKQKEHTRIVYDLDDIITKKKPAHERLGKRRLCEDKEDFRGIRKRVRITDEKSRRNNEEKTRNNEEKDRKRGLHRENVLSRLGVLSKVSVPPKKPVEPQEEEEETQLLHNREVASVVKVKRVLPPNAPQPNKNLLLKAVADAQRSIAQTPAVGSTQKPDALFTKKYKENDKKKQRSKLQDIISHISKNNEITTKLNTNETEYVPKPVRQNDSIKSIEYIPSSKESLMILEETKKHEPCFIVTLDGIDKRAFEKPTEEEEEEEKKRRTPSPIVFDIVTSPVRKKINVPDILPKVYTSPSVKNKERCKYWPSCRQGEKCEFVHPVTACKMFPQCKFKDKCLYIHPSCKFESSCTRKDCPYSHILMPKSIANRATHSVPVNQTCKYFPNCTNVHCTFYHPKPCKFGKFCKNQLECTFSHPKTANMTWRNDLKAS